MNESQSLPGNDQAFPREKFAQKARKLRPSVIDESLLPPARVIGLENRLSLGAMLGYEAWAYYQTMLGWIPGRSGWILRRIFYKPFFQRAGDGWHIAEYASIQRVSHFQIGNLCSIGRYSVINALGGVIIGEYSGCGPYCQINSTSHNFLKRSITHMDKGAQPRLMETAPIIIEDNVWIGAGCIILPGVRIGSNAVIGAGAVVNKDIPPFALAGGVPAKVIRISSEEEEESREGDMIWRSVAQDYANKIKNVS